MVSQFLVAFLQWRVLNDALHHIVGAVYAGPLLLVPNISFGVLDYGEVKKGPLARSSRGRLLRCGPAIPTHPYTHRRQPQHRELLPLTM